jgi:hypothetical protein
MGFSGEALYQQTGNAEQFERLAQIAPPAVKSRDVLGGLAEHFCADRADRLSHAHGSHLAQSHVQPGIAWLD